MDNKLIDSEDNKLLHSEELKDTGVGALWEQADKAINSIVFMFIVTFSLVIILMFIVLGSEHETAYKMIDFIRAI